MLRTVYQDSSVEPPLMPPEPELKRPWERADAIRELIRGRMETAGPVVASALAGLFQLSQTEIDAGLLALEAEGFVLERCFATRWSLAGFDVGDLLTEIVESR